MQYLRTAYELLPPPLAALPAKYWTSISLWLHSYTVGRMFQELVNAYTRIRETTDSPNEREAFIIGFLHDMGQKLGVTNKRLDNVKKWVESKLQTKLGFSEKESYTLSKYMITNVAETRRDPTYPKEIWTLLWLADRMQGTSNIADIISYVDKIRDMINIKLVVNYYNILSPHPFLRAILHKIMFNTLIQEVVESSANFILPISTPHGLIVLSDEPIGDIEFEWDEIRKLEEADALLSEAMAEQYWQYIEYCRGNRKDKPKGWKSKNCKPLGSPKISTYETVILYYGPEEYSKKIDKRIVLPSSFATQLIGIRIKGVSYSDGTYVCPFCGVNTPHGIYPSEIADIIGGAAKEKWCRRYPPSNLNVLLSSGKMYLACPLCLGEALLYKRLFMNVKGEKVFISITLQAPLPVPVLVEVGALLQYLVSRSGETLFGTEKKLENLLKIDILSDIPKEASTFAFDPFSATLYGITGLTGENVEITIKGITLAGLLASWGLYPLLISPTTPLSPSRKLLSFYKGQKPLYDFEPADKKLGKYTPYVSLLLLSIGYLYYRRIIRGESLPAVTEILDYPPVHAPHLLQYASPRLYTHFESLRLEIEGGDT